MNIKISFLHNARPYIASDEYANISFEAGADALPCKGDIVALAGIKHPNGSFVVSHRVFHTDPVKGFESVELFLTTEDDISYP